MTKKDSCIMEMPLSASRHPFSAILFTIERSEPVVRLAEIYSLLLGEPVSSRQTLHLLHVQAACLLLLFPAPLAAAVRLLFLCWTVLAVRQCRALFMAGTSRSADS